MAQQQSKEPCKKEACDIQACLSKNNFLSKRFSFYSSFRFFIFNFMFLFFLYIIKLPWPPYSSFFETPTAALVGYHLSSWIVLLSFDYFLFLNENYIEHRLNICDSSWIVRLLFMFQLSTYRQSLNLMQFDDLAGFGLFFRFACFWNSINHNYSCTCCSFSFLAEKNKNKKFQNCFCI